MIGIGTSGYGGYENSELVGLDWAKKVHSIKFIVNKINKVSFKLVTKTVKFHAITNKLQFNINNSKILFIVKTNRIKFNTTCKC